MGEGELIRFSLCISAFLMISYCVDQVEDRGSAIKGPSRVDLYHKSHKDALHWGRRKLKVRLFSSSVF